MSDALYRERIEAEERPLTLRFFLRDCPFCGQPPTVTRMPHGGRDKFKIECVAEGCKAAAYVTGRTELEAATRWNRRR